MPELAIIADDLTGALDAAAPFAARGLDTRVALDPSCLPQALATGPRIIAVSTNSREIPPEAAYEAVRAAIAALPPRTPLFKKVDSRLKGNIASELDAIAPRLALVAPAIPDFGRVARQGHLEGFGVQEPIDIAQRLGRHALGARIPDVIEKADFHDALDEPFDLPVGARGLAEVMAERMAPGREPYRFRWTGGIVLGVIGSTDPITIGQVEHLRSQLPDLAYVAAPNGVGTAPGPAARTLIQAVSGPHPAAPEAVSKALAQTVLHCAVEPGALLVLSGGASAQAILRGLGISTLRLLGEAQPGLPVAEAGDLTVVTKSGGFGDPETLSRLFSAPSPIRGSAHVG